ncbi:uncharacterized protein LOC144879202 [Branchiostoma floridae x Branchiostoma japonicum]
MSKRQCCVFDCKNGGRKLNKWKEETCTIHDRKHKSCICDEPFRLHPFPTERKAPETRKEWIRLVGRQSLTNRNKNWVPNEDSRICSIHFVDGEPTDDNPLPTQHLNTPRLLQSPTPKARKKPTPRPFVESTSRERIAKNSTVATDETGASGSSSTKDYDVPHDYDKLSNDDKVQFYSGLPNRKAFEQLYSYLAPKLKSIRYWRGTSSLPKGVRRFTKSPKKFGPGTKLSAKDLLVMTLMKLRLGLLNEDLADRFGVSPSTCSRALTSTLKFLASELKFEI